MRPLLEVAFALERVTLPVFTFCAPAFEVSAGLAGVTVLLVEEEVLLEAVLEEVPVLEEPVFTCLLAVVPVEVAVLRLLEVLVLLEADVLLEEVPVLRLLDVAVLLDAEDVPVVRRSWLEEDVAGAAVLRDAEDEVLLEAVLEEVLLAGAAVVVVADLLSEELVLLLVEVVVLRLA